jgi:hypothetical protein
MDLVEPIFKPQKVDFYLQNLENDTLDNYYRILRIFEYAAEQIGGTRGEHYKATALELINEGLMRPMFIENGYRFRYYMEVWSYFDGTFKHISQMAPWETKWIRDSMDYYDKRN